MQLLQYDHIIFSNSINYYTYDQNRGLIESIFSDLFQYFNDKYNVHSLYKNK